MDSEVSFPRGRITTKGKGFSGPIDTIFSFPKKGNKQKPESRKRKRSDSHSDVVQNKELQATTANILTYEQVQEGMLILGCIRSISPLSIEVELPGKICGRIQISGISDHYTQFLQQKLAEKDIGEEKDLARLKSIFHVGQFVPTKLIQKLSTPKGTKLTLSMNPTDVYADWTHRVLQPDLLMWAAVESELDHGYQLDAGINNCRIFLPHANVRAGTTFMVGQPLWCAVQKCDINFAASTVVVSILEKHMNTAMQNVRLNLHHLIPGMQFDLTVTKVLKNGLQGEFMNNCSGYVNEAYLTAPLEKISKYKAGQVVQVYFLYIQPTTKFSYFSLRNLQVIHCPEYAIGTILQSKVFSRTGGGVNLKLPNGEKGFVSFKRIIREMSNKSNLNDVVANKYAQGSSHQCRILDYQHFEQVYICTFEQAVLKQKLFNISDVKIGELVNVSVRSITKEGLVVQLGNMNAFIHNSHLSNMAYSENIKRKFNIGQRLQARVWSIDDRGVYLTHKQTLLDSNLCLSKIDDTAINKQYPGMVVKNCRDGVLVIFYGCVRGWLSKVHLNEFYGDNVGNMFYEGQVIMTTIRKIGNNILHLVLDPPKPSKRKAFRIGDYVDATVTKITEDGLEVEAGANQIKAFVPVNHLSSSLSLTSLLLKTYSVGNILKDLLCISDRGVPILSPREAAAYKRDGLKVSQIKDLTEGSLVRCSYDSSYESGIVVSLPSKPSNLKLKIVMQELVSNPKSVCALTLQPQQPIIAKIVKLDPKNKQLKITAKLEEVFSLDCKDCIDNFKQYLDDMKQIQLHLLKQDSPLGQLQLGQRVECTVHNITQFGCSVLLKGDVQGFVPQHHHSKRMKLGQKLRGVVLWVNYNEDFVYVSFAEHVLEKVSPVQDGTIDKAINSTVRADVLIVHDDCVVAVMQNKQLVCVPTQIHVNAFTEKVVYKEMQKIKLVIVRQVDGKIIGIDRKIKHELQKMKSTSSKPANINKKQKTNNQSNSNKRAPIELGGISSFATGKGVTEENAQSSDDNSSQAQLSDEMEYKEEENSSEENESVADFEEDKKEELESVVMDVTVDDDFEDENVKVENYSSESENEVESEIEENVQNGWEDAESNDDSEDQLMDGDSEDDDSNKVESENENSDDSEDENDDNQVGSDDENSSDAVDEGSFEAEEQSASTASMQNRFTLNKAKRRNEKNVDSIENNTKIGISSALPGIQNFFDGGESLKSKKVSFEDSSDDEVAEEQVILVTKKKLTLAERRALVREEEERLRKKEIEIANCTEEPQSEEQFCMLLAGKPNCSELWAKYIAYCISNAEIHKARNVAQTALEKINLQETAERYNIWIILLNLENSYGDKESFNKVFEEAVRCNDDLRMYLDVISILADSQKYTEMEEKIKKVRSKYKHDTKMWLDIVRTYYKIGQWKEARNLQNAALKNIEKKAKHIDLIVQFAIMEFQYGESNHAESLFESVLQTAPRRVDVWCTYVDQVIKKSNTDGARRILERAVSQSIPVKKMKTLFQKFKDLEIKYGNQQRVEYVIELARKYVGLTQD